MLSRLSRGGTLLLAASLWATAASAEESRGSCRPPGIPVKGLDLRPPCSAEDSPPAVPAATPNTWQEAPEEEPSPKLRARRREPPLDQWYGWQTLLVDGAATGIFFAGTAGSNGGVQGELLLLGLVGYVAGGPIVHAIHDRPTVRVLGSAGLRLGLPLIGGVVGSSVADCQHSSEFDDVGGAFCEIGYAGLGVLAGMGVAIVADAALSFEPSRPRKTNTGFVIAPSVSLTEHETRFGVIGQF